MSSIPDRVGNQAPVLRGERLQLRPLRPDDDRALLQLARDEKVTRYLHEGPTPDMADIGVRIAGALRQWDVRGYGMMAAEDMDRIVGQLGVYHPPHVEQALLVYAFKAHVWGRGYATEGVGLLLSWLRVHHPKTAITAHIDPANAQSRRVVKKFGAQWQGTTERNGTTLNVFTIPAPRTAR